MNRTFDPATDHSTAGEPADADGKAATGSVSADTSHRLLRSWQLAILRYAVTMDDVDWRHVMGLARELDCQADGSEREATFSFFRKMSGELGPAIESDPDSAVIKHFIAEMNDERMERAFKSALGHVEQAAPPNRRAKPIPSLFRGLPSRKVS